MCDLEKQLDEFLKRDEVYLLEIIRCIRLGKLPLTLAGIFLGISLVKYNWIPGYIFSVIIQSLILISLIKSIKECSITITMIYIILFKSGFVLTLYILISKYLLSIVSNSLVVALIITISIFLHRVVIDRFLKRPFLYHIYRSIHLALVIPRDIDEGDVK